MKSPPPPFVPDHRAGPAGTAAWATPDPSQPPVGGLLPSEPVAVVARHGGWVQVATADGRLSWVDGTQLLPLAVAAPAMDAPPVGPPAGMPPTGPGRRSRRGLWVALGVMIIAGAATGGVAWYLNSNRSSESTAATPTVTGQPSTTVGTETTGSGATTPTTVVDPTEGTTATSEATTTTAVSVLFVDPLDDPSSIPPWDEPVDPLYEGLSGGPDEESTAAFAVVLADTGLDPTGIEAWIWPVIGSDDVLLILNIDDIAVGLLDDEEAVVKLWETLLSPVLEDAGVTRLVMNYRSTDDQGPFTLSATFAFDVVLQSMRDQTDLPFEDGLFRLIREE